MRFTIPIDFDLPAFISGCLSSGVSLEKTDATPNPDGYLVMSGTILSVNLTEPTPEKEAAVTAKVLELGGQVQ